MSLIPVHSLYLINASYTLEAGVKIYSLRVDSIHSEAYKVLGGINRAGYENEQVSDYVLEEEATEYVNSIHIDVYIIPFLKYLFLLRVETKFTDYILTGLSSFTLVNLFVREFGYTAFNTIGGHLQDELEITSKALVQRGGYDGTLVLVRNKATGELIAEDVKSKTPSQVQFPVLSFLKEFDYK
ncbi:hypothetical protein F3Y22_tig00110890pilonHSYRG00068 [Hibiscus syriacus]|uniref:Condensin complex subunit 2 n=1 Tax=Hibiscus syriacus TaxID=106335 RepID=A0A6A2ZH85_HIBSY|nr:hypothetical protein F3Y22_tig00110890pilonHSYRG00068 [Hibiscus syriacus]